MALNQTKFLGAIFLGLLAISTQARAEDSSAAAAVNESTSSGGSFMKTVKERLGASYQGQYYGSSFESMRGDYDGRGTSLELDHYFGLSWKTGKNTKLSATQLIIQEVDQNDKNPSFWAYDTYFTFTHSKLYSNEKAGFNLLGYVRYYAPTSRRTHDKAMNGFYSTSLNGANDISYGNTRFLLKPSFDLFGGKVNVTGTAYASIRLAGSEEERVKRQREYLSRTGGDPAGATALRDQLHVLFDPVITYNFSPTFDMYVEYCTGAIHRNSAGRWSSSNDPSDGEYYSLGADWQATKRLSLTPYLQWGEYGSAGTTFRGFNRTLAGLYLNYVIL